jgi:hypothetical protein
VVDRRLRCVVVLLVLAWVFHLHRWVPAALVVTFVAWVLLHKRLEAGLGERLARRWRGTWPYGSSILIALAGVSAAAFVLADAPVLMKVMPVAIAVAALSIVSSTFVLKGARR